jgi:hypothetical protein
LDTDGAEDDAVAVTQGHQGRHEKGRVQHVADWIAQYKPMKKEKEKGLK